MKSKKILTIIIVSYNTKEMTLRCIESVRKTALPQEDFEIIVVDNASHDGSVESIQHTFPDVHIIRNSKNLGFSAGNNVAIRKAEGMYVLLLNSDTEVSPDVFSMMVEFMENHPYAGVSTCKLMLTDGSMDPACHRGFPTPWAACTYMLGIEKLFPKTHIFGQYHQGFKNMSVPHEIDCPSGAFFLVRKEVIDHVGMLDEDYFMYGEDIDWAYRIKKKGWKIWFNPDVSILHLKKQSGRKHVNNSIVKHANANFYETMKLFYKKHYEKVYPWIVTRLVYFALDVRIRFLITLGK